MPGCRFRQSGHGAFWSRPRWRKSRGSRGPGLRSWCVRSRLAAGRLLL